VEGVVSIADAEDPVIDATDVAARFRAFCASVEPGLRRALIAAYGAAAGRDAAAEALAWAWEHFGRVERMRNPGGYLYRVGQTAARRERVTDRWPLPVSLANESAEPYVEPALAEALAGLSPHQRAAVLLVHGFGYSLSEASQQMGCRIRTLRNHLDRGLGKLRVALGVDIDG
jgi:DNA-directed RNA polymerase specialized sigma24 family protein